MKKGFGGDKIKNTEVLTGFDAVDLMGENNATGICYQQRGKKDFFARGTLSDKPILRSPRWFKFGNNCVIEVKEQMEIGEW